LVYEVCEPVGVGGDRLVLEEEVGQVHLVVVGAHPQPPLVEADGVVRFDPEVLVQEFVQLVEGLWAGQMVFLDRLEDRVETVGASADLGVEQRFRILVVPSALEPAEHRRLRHVEDPFAERRIHARPLHEPHARSLGVRVEIAYVLMHSPSGGKPGALGGRDWAVHGR
jgi:hypothetical protein